MGPCIVNIFQYIYNKMPCYTVYLYLETALHTSGGTSTHHQDRIQLYLQHLVFVRPLLLPAASGNVDVEQFPDINKLCNVASCCIYIGKYLPLPLPYAVSIASSLPLSLNTHQKYVFDTFSGNIFSLSLPWFFNPLNPELNPICYLLALLAHHFLHVSRIRVKSLPIRLLMSYIYMERLFLMFLDHTQRCSTVGRTPLDE